MKNSEKIIDANLENVEAKTISNKPIEKELQFSLPKSVIDDITSYLGKKPFEEVFQLIDKMKTNIKQVILSENTKGE